MQETDVAVSPDLEGRWGLTKQPRRGTGSVWPSPGHELLLRAALFEGEMAQSAWRQWSDIHPSPGDLEPGSDKLLPLVYYNLHRQGFQDERIAALMTYYLVTWASNLNRFQVLGRIVERFQTAGIETLALKGAALIPLYYKDLGRRGMTDIDVLVPEDRFGESVELLLSAGWLAHHWKPIYFDTRFQHAIPLFDAEQNAVDLHCHVLATSCEPGADRRFWEDSLPVDLRGAKTRSLGPSDLLLHVCAHGMKASRNAPGRWVADAVTVMREAGPIDWRRLVELSKSRGITLQVSAALDFLREKFEAPVPGEVVASLCSTPAARLERLRFETWKKTGRGRLFSLLAHHWCMYSRGIGSVGPVRQIQMIPQYLRFWAQTDNLWKIPRFLSVKAIRLIGYRLGLYRYWEDRVD